MNLNANRRRPLYQPALLLLLAACLGIVLDRLLGMGWAVWSVGALSGLVGWVIGQRFPMSVAKRSFLLLFVAGCVGGLWHHVRWNYFGPTEIGFFASNEFQPCRIQAKVSGSPQLLSEPTEDHLQQVNRGVRTRFPVQVTAIRDHDRWQTASGSAFLLVDGQAGFVCAGDQIEVVGKLIQSQRPRNPGAFDFYSYNRGQGKFCLVFASYPQAIEVVESQNAVVHWVSISGLRQRLNQVIWKHVDQERAPIASAILLGNRVHLSDELEQSFLVSGTIHLLAISGLHVGILAAGFLFLARLDLLPRHLVYLTTILVVLAYCWLVEFRPPVLRASILVALFCVGRMIGRDGFSINTLSIAAILVLTYNPVELFSSGAQLSFLAVATLGFARQWLQVEASSDPLDQLVERTRPLPIQWGRKFLRIGWQTYLVSLAIWMAAAPLVALRFHIISPVGILINPLLLIPLAMALYFGFLTMVVGGWIPWLGDGAGAICDGALRLMQTMVSAAEGLSWGHVWTSGPSEISVAIFYLLFFFCLGFRTTRLPARWLITLFFGWVAFGWCLPNFYFEYSKGHDELVATFVDVGHGTSVLIELPDGQVMLYDAGSFAAPKSGAQQIACVLWSKRIDHIDAVVVSHDDLDHFNALPDLCRRFSIGCVYFSPVMSRSESVSARTCREILTGFGVPIRTLEEGQTLASTMEGLKLRVLSPPAPGTGEATIQTVLFFPFVGEAKACCYQEIWSKPDCGLSWSNLRSHTMSQWLPITAVATVARIVFTIGENQSSSLSVATRTR